MAEPYQSRRIAPTPSIMVRAKTHANSTCLHLHGSLSFGLSPARPAIFRGTDRARRARGKRKSRPIAINSSRGSSKLPCIVPMSDEPLPQAPAADTCPAAAEPPPALARGQVTFSDAPSKPSIQVELASTDQTRERGLMYRKRLDSEAGMLFSWGSESPRTFWMHNTCIPLDMLFIAKDGTISGVLEQVPVLNDEPRGVPCPVAHVLEVNAGWVRGHHVKPGQHLTISLP